VTKVVKSLRLVRSLRETCQYCNFFNPEIVYWPNYSQRAQDFVFQRFDPYVEIDDYRSTQIDYINSMGQYLSH
jgi:hypothetical protein